MTLKMLLFHYYTNGNPDHFLHHFVAPALEFNSALPPRLLINVPI